MGFHQAVEGISMMDRDKNKKEGIRDKASPGEGSSSGSPGGKRAPSGSDELVGDTSRTGKSGQSTPSGTPGSPSDTRSSGNHGGSGKKGTSR
jgi:hypothetical protein